MNVLVIEDDPTSLKLANLVLESQGYKVNSTEAAEKAMESIKRDKPDVILLDLALPGMDGFSLARLLKQDPSTRDIPIIAMTSYPDRFPQQEATKAGCNAYVVKPIDTRLLPKKIAEIVSQKHKSAT
jgi:CheY-like chemotaxis protein